MQNYQPKKSEAQELRERLQICVAEVIRLLEAGNIRDALTVLRYADQHLESGALLLTDNQHLFFHINLGRFHDAARYLNNTKMIKPLLATTKNELLENSGSESDSEVNDGKQEQDDPTTNNNNNPPKPNDKKCSIL